MNEKKNVETPVSRDEYVEYTEEGWKKAAASLTAVPEEDRDMMLAMLISSLING